MKRRDNPHLCVHANECPATCPCKRGCYCKARTCDPRKRLSRAQAAHGGDSFSTHHEVRGEVREYFYWAWEFMWMRDAAHVAASLTLDGLDVRDLP